MTGQEAPVPIVDDIDTGGFWRATARHELAILTCLECSQVLHLPTAFCYACGSWDTEWIATRPLGRLYSWTTVHRQIHPAFTVPYTIILVELVDVPEARLVGHLPGAPELAAGLELAVRFEDRDGVTLPVWYQTPVVDAIDEYEPEGAT